MFGVRLSAFNLPQIARLTYTDDLHLEELGEKKVALFCCIPDSDRSLNYLVGMIYGQLIQTLYYVADRKYKGRLPVPVHLLIDEAPNIALPTDNFLPWLSTMRSRAIFCSYIAQNMAQIKALFKEQWESLGGVVRRVFSIWAAMKRRPHKYVSELMGKETPGYQHLRPQPWAKRQLQRPRPTDGPGYAILVREEFSCLEFIMTGTRSTGF